MAMIPYLLYWFVFSSNVMYALVSIVTLEYVSDQGRA